MTQSRHIIRQRATWTDDMIQALRERYPREITRALAEDLGLTCAQVYQQAARLGIKKSEAFHASPASGRLGHGKGKSCRFQKGHTPANKGLRRPGWAPGRMAETQFKKGEMRGATQHNYVPIGTLRISKDGYLERKVTDDHPVPARRWVAVHRLVWIDANGPVPDGHIVRFKAGMKTSELEEVTLDKLECISKADNMKRNTLHRYPKEIAKLIQLRGALTRQIHKKEKAA